MNSKEKLIKQLQNNNRINFYSQILKLIPILSIAIFCPIIIWDNFYSGLKSAFGRLNEPKGLFPHEAIAMGFMADNQVNQDKAQEFLTARMRKEF